MRRPGHTLIELLLVLLVLGILLGLASPPLGRWRDTAHAAAARDELAGRLAWTRVAATAHGGARLVLALPDGRYRVEAGDGALLVHGDLAGRYGIRVSTAGEPDSVVLRYDAIGIGRMTGRTLRVTRGRATASLSVTPFGRYRRW
jgi:prepilin-type N-terminal cleavage/methylation domain-containing protein